MKLLLELNVCQIYKKNSELPEILKIIKYADCSKMKGLKV